MSSPNRHKVSWETWQLLKDDPFFPLLQRLLESIKLRVIKQAMVSQGSREDQLSHFYIAKGWVQCIDSLLLGTLDNEAVNVLGDGILQELDQPEDYMPQLRNSFGG